MRVIIAVLTQRASQSFIALPLLLWQFHDGLGFLTNHGVLSNTFEASLQTVNPKLTLPYWDFTIETSSAGASGDTSAYQSQTKTPIFQESWFGSVDHTDDMVSMLLLPKASERGSLKCMCGFMFLRERPTYRTDGRRPRLRPLAKSTASSPGVDGRSNRGYASRQMMGRPSVRTCSSGLYTQGCKSVRGFRNTCRMSAYPLLQVKDGRWAFTEIPKMRKNNPGGVEPDVYSKLRAPWNVNDRA